MSNTILIVEDDIMFATLLKTWLGKKGYIVYTAISCKSAEEIIQKESIDIVISDLRLPDHDGIELLLWMKENGYQMPLIIMTGYAEIQSAVHAIKLGASDYIAKPIRPEELLIKIEDTLSSNIEKNAVRINRNLVAERNSGSNGYVEGESESAQQLYNYVSLVAPTPMTVLINGASGTGKEYVAHRIHELSKRSDKPFIAIDCGSIPKELAASEFFGHVKGSFTGAINDKSGAFVEANGGTLFLDEIGNLSYEVQIQLLRALQEKKIKPIGSNKEIECDVRVISATNEDLNKAILKGTFREDLFHRINEFTIKMPALKERGKDIIVFANFFLKKANEELERNIEGFDTGAIELMLSYAWPGNLRQMNNVIKRATLLAANSYITAEDIKNDLYEVKEEIDTLNLYDANSEQNRIIEALKISNYNKSKAAKLLRVDRKTLYNKIKLYGL